MAAEVPFDVLEQILIRLDVKDLLRWKSVCKFWQSFISTPGFVKAHLKHDRQNIGDGRRIGVNYIVLDDETSLIGNSTYIVGSCNGLVCVSPEDIELEVTNPSTRETKKLPTPPYRPDENFILIRQAIECLGFGYDASADDYKVIVGFMNCFMGRRTIFHVLTLKSNTWKVIREIEYLTVWNGTGILCGGALHWIMIGKRCEKVIISLDLSTEEFKETPHPAEETSDYFDLNLGVIEDCLCIYSRYSPLSEIKWVMKNNKWEPYNNESKYDVARYCLSRHPVADSQNRTSYVYTHDDGRLVPSSAGAHIRASVFVKSLVSPHPHKGQLEGNGAKGKIRKRSKKRKRSSKGMFGFTYFTNLLLITFEKKKKKRKKFLDNLLKRSFL